MSRLWQVLKPPPFRAELPVSGRMTFLTPQSGKANAPAMPEQDEAIAQLSFEAALKRLEEIVRRLESGEESLDESIRLYGEGDALKKQCEARLEAAQAKIERIQFGRDGQPSGTAPFDGG